MPKNNTINDDIPEIIERFHSIISRIIKIVDSKLPGDIEIDRLKRIIRLARSEFPLLIMDKSKDYFWEHREQILDEDESYFLNKDYSIYIDEGDEDKEFISKLIKSFKTIFPKLSPKEKVYLWKLNKNILESVIKYKVLTNEHN